MTCALENTIVPAYNYSKREKIMPQKISAENSTQQNINELNTNENATATVVSVLLLACTIGTATKWSDC
jgi:hypothetical protein